MLCEKLALTMSANGAGSGIRLPKFMYADSLANSTDIQWQIIILKNIFDLCDMSFTLS